MKTTQIILVILIHLMVVMPLVSQTMEDKMCILELINDARISAGIRPYKYSMEADTLAKRRNQTVNDLYTKEHTSRYDRFKSEESDSFLHYIVDVDVRWYNMEVVPQDTTITFFSECAALVTDKIGPMRYGGNLINICFYGWKNSPGHWKDIMDPSFQYMAIQWSTYNSGDGGIDYVIHIVLFDKRARINPKYRKHTTIPLDTK